MVLEPEISGFAPPANGLDRFKAWSHSFHGIVPRDLLIGRVVQTGDGIT